MFSITSNQEFKRSQKLCWLTSKQYKKMKTSTKTKKSTFIILRPLSPSSFSGKTAARIINNRNLFSRVASCKRVGLLLYKYYWQVEMHPLQFTTSFTSFVVRNLITSFIPASPKTRSCSSWPSSRSPDSLIILLIFPAICIHKTQFV